MQLISWIALLLSLLVTISTLLVFRKLAPSWGLIDQPSERKLHKGNTPLIGGLGVALGMAASLCWWLPFNPLISSFLVGSAVVVFVGLLDDIYDVSIRVRFFGQAIAASVVIVSGDTYLMSLGDLFGSGEIQLLFIALPFTLFAMIGVMNAFNMIDGIDGLLGCASLVATLGILILSLAAGNSMLSFISGVIAASLIPYLIFNLLPAANRHKVFMGDAGSLLMGFALTWLFIVGSQSHLTTIPVFEPVTALFLVAIPLMDIITVIARRIKQKRSPCRADRQHIHHLFGKAGYSERHTLIILSSIMLSIASIGVVLELVNVSQPTRFATLILLLVTYVWLTKTLKRRMTRLVKQREKGSSR
jgi:UDP-GlcNAc:undecaprenyl-phosphate GlcNAc-1-phosphate transferase